MWMVWIRAPTKKKRYALIIPYTFSYTEFSWFDPDEDRLCCIDVYQHVNILI